MKPDSKLIAGVDEAGRGPVIGPMVLCAFACEPQREGELKAMGARDSKVLTAANRERLEKLLRNFGVFVVRKITAVELTELMRSRVSLNEIEAKCISEMLLELGRKNSLSSVYIDSPDPVAAKFERRIRKYFDHQFEIVCEHKADANYPVVSAASIIAKVERDAEIEGIKRELAALGMAGDFGTGYSHDARTIEFLRKYREEGALRKYVRHEWETARRIGTDQVDLSAYL
ncbi:ribonuclease HII [Candidatus Micrarchaeota archaeon]|nr:ribonuclease HII [Candidatus Micrarchaeota archaeon]